MLKEGKKYLQLGLFVTGGLVFLLVMLYMIGKNKHLLGKGFRLRARFENIQGLKIGNNVRFAGIDAGTVEDIRVINDTLIEINMRLDAAYAGIIRQNALVSIGTDGLVGNKIINILAQQGLAIPVEDQGLLPSKKPLDTDDLLQTFSKTNRNLLEITHRLNHFTANLDSSSFLQALLTDTILIAELNRTVTATKKSVLLSQQVISEMHNWTRHISSGGGLMGALIYDTSIIKQASTSIRTFQHTGEHITELSDSILAMTASIKQLIDTGSGMIPLLWKDGSTRDETKKMISSSRLAANQMTEILDALKQSIFFRGYFRRKNRK